jgi:hypothetical protein
MNTLNTSQSIIKKVKKGNILSTALHWLPLTTNTNNYGTSSVSPNVRGTITFSTQLSKNCGYFDNATSTGAGTQNPQKGNDIVIPFLADNTTDFTVACWIYASTGYYNPFSISNGTTV